jgi:hypothetical protein
MLLFLGHTAIRLADARSSTARAAANAADAASLADEIRLLRSGQRVAGIGALRNDELARLTERAAAEAGIEREAIQRIAPSVARRVADGHYLEQRTQVMIRGASLAHLLTLLHKLEAEANLRAIALRLTAPRGEDGAAGWQVELTLRHLIYAPRAPTAAAAARAAREVP